MIQCNRCNLQYIGETKRRLKDRFNEHRRTIDNPNTKSKPTTAAEHFLTATNHTANDMQSIPIENVFSNRGSVRKAREAFLISKCRTLLPYGLTSIFPFIFIYLFLFCCCNCIYILLFHFLYLLYTVNLFSFTHFRYCVNAFSYKHMPQWKFLIVPEEGWLGQPKYSTFF